jgi:hypothetical protein
MTTCFRDYGATRTRVEVTGTSIFEVAAVGIAQLRVGRLDRAARADASGERQEDSDCTNKAHTRHRTRGLPHFLLVLRRYIEARRMDRHRCTANAIPIRRAHRPKGAGCSRLRRSRDDATCITAPRTTIALSIQRSRVSPAIASAISERSEGCFTTPAAWSAIAP